jgi:hypothetical protein
MQTITPAAYAVLYGPSCSCGCRNGWLQKWLAIATNYSGVGTAAALSCGQKAPSHEWLLLLRRQWLPLLVADVLDG